MRTRLCPSPYFALSLYLGAMLGVAFKDLSDGVYIQTIYDANLFSVSRFQSQNAHNQIPSQRDAKITCGWAKCSSYADNNTVLITLTMLEEMKQWVCRKWKQRAIFPCPCRFRVAWVVNCIHLLLSESRRGNPESIRPPGCEHQSWVNIRDSWCCTYY